MSAWVMTYYGCPSTRHMLLTAITEGRVPNCKDLNHGAGTCVQGGRGLKLCRRDFPPQDKDAWPSVEGDSAIFTSGCLY